MTGLPLILLIITLIISSNGFLIGYFDKITMYKGVEMHYYPGWLVILCICFCIFLFPFYKLVGEYRKVLYMKSKIKNYEYWNMIHNEADSQWGNGSMGTASNEDYESYVNYKRYLKLKEIKRKSKWRKLWN
jgi:hypothetical protein